VAVFTGKLPPGPKGCPVLGNMLGYAGTLWDCLTRCSRQYGDVARLRFAGPSVYLLSRASSA